MLLFNYKVETTRDWQNRKQDVLNDRFLSYDTVYPEKSGDSLVLGLS